MISECLAEINTNDHNVSCVHGHSVEDGSTATGEVAMW